MGRTGTGVEARKNSIRIAFTLDGKQERKTLVINGMPMSPTLANLKYAERLVAEIRQKIRLGNFSMQEYFPSDKDTHTQGTVGEQLETWLKAQRIEQSTRDGYSSAARFWKKAPCNDRGTPLGDQSLAGLRTSHIQRAIASRSDLSGKTINNYLSALREAVELAVSDKLLGENPVAKVPRAKHQKSPPDPFSRDETEQIIASLHATGPEQVANLVEFWFWSGPRTSEIFGQRWPNVDLPGRKVKVTEAVVRGNRKDRTKTNVERTVHLNSRAHAAIDRQLEYTGEAEQDVFNDPRYDTPWNDERAFRRSYWVPTLKKLEIRYRRPYNMRHTYATQMLMAGMTPAFCATQMGHSTEVFLKTYAKWLNGAQNDREMQRLELALAGNLTPV